MTSAVGTRFAGLFPATWIPKIDSDGCRRTKDHSSFEPARKEVARPTECDEFPYLYSKKRSWKNDLLSPQVISAPKSTQRRRKGCN